MKYVCAFCSLWNILSLTHTHNNNNPRRHDVLFVLTYIAEHSSLVHVAVGGIVRQVFSPIFSGGCVICCPSFDPSIFWALLSKRAFTWYYAAPTMHQLILQQGREDGHITDDGELFNKCPFKLRMIANAAGGLLPSLAQEMMKTFDANVSTRGSLYITF